MVKKTKNNNGSHFKEKILVPASKLPIEKIRERGDFRKTIQWRIFRIMSEFIEGFQFLTDFPKTISFFGSARFTAHHPFYKEARRLAHLLVKAGFGIVTGGGPGIMEAGNRGAYESKGISLGLNIQLPYEQRINEYVKKGIGFNYFFVRKVMLTYAAQAYVFFPGGFGTLDEVTELITLIQTKKIDHIPIICIGINFWKPFFEWIKNVVYEKYQAIDKEDLNLYYLVDSADEAFEIIQKSKSRRDLYF